MLKSDTTAIAGMTAADFVEISRLGQIRTKADNLRELATGALKLTTVKYDSLSVRIYGDVAVLQGIADNAGSFRGFPFAGKRRYTRIFVRRDGRWQAVARVISPGAAPIFPPARAADGRCERGNLSNPRFPCSHALRALFASCKLPRSTLQLLASDLL